MKQNKPISLSKRAIFLGVGVFLMVGPLAQAADSVVPGIAFTCPKNSQISCNGDKWAVTGGDGGQWSIYGSPAFSCSSAITVIPSIVTLNKPESGDVVCVYSLTSSGKTNDEGLAIKRKFGNIAHPASSGWGEDVCNPTLSLLNCAWQGQ